MTAVSFDQSRLSIQALAFLEIVKQRHSGCLCGNSIIIGERHDDLSMRISCNSAITWRERCKRFGCSLEMTPNDIEGFCPKTGLSIPTDEFLKIAEIAIMRVYGELPSAPHTHQAWYTGRNLRKVAGRSGNEIIEFVAADFFKFLQDGALE